MEEFAGSYNTWDIVILAVAGYVAVTALVRLMKERHRHLLDELREQFREEQSKRKVHEMAAQGRRGQQSNDQQAHPNRQSRPRVSA